MCCKQRHLALSSVEVVTSVFGARCGARAENIPSKKRTKRLWEKDAPPTREFGSLTDVEGAGEQCRGNLPPGGAVAMLQWREKERALSPKPTGALPRQPNFFFPKFESNS
ncbi:hypothetical protein CEXT_567961 [Caerostris extrusa]|uniref:Secreted protein n=1 Tax=Caerostris extrusa TaxID=172846 RepID=A0AAV4PYU2_CAEEX|nr:hypothetical protein CEXT_567961 [Caerostris extrusa]